MPELRLQTANCLADRVGEHGIEARSMAGAAGRMAEIVDRLNETRGTGWERWRDLPFDPMRTEHTRAIETTIF